MTFNVNSNINQYPQTLTGLSSSPLPTVNNEKIKQDLNNNAVVKKANSASDKPGVVFALTAAFWAVLSQTVARFNNACRGGKILDKTGKFTGKYDGVYEKSVLGKIDAWGQKMGKKPFFDNKLMESFGEGLKNTKSFVKEHFINKFKIPSAIVNTPSKPSFPAAQMMMEGTLGEVASNATNFFNKYIGVDSKDLEKFISDSSKTKTPQIEEALDKISKLGFKDVDDYLNVMKNSHDSKSIDKIIEVCSKEHMKDVSLDIGKYASKYTKEGSYLRKIFGTEVAATEIKNKLIALNIGENASLGKTLSKGTMRLVESLTNGTAGGKFVIVMQAYFLADALKKAYHAPKGDKFQTFMEELVSGTAMYLTMPLAMKLMHGVGGLQYIGLNKEQVAKFREKLITFNDKAEKRLFDTVKDFNAEKPTLKALKKENLSLFKRTIYKPFEILGKLVTTGLEVPRGFVAKDAGKLMEKFKNTKFFVKRGLGFPIRFLIFGLVIAPPLSKLAVKISHLFFGRPTKSLLDEEKTEEKKQEAEKPATAQTPQNTSLLPQAVKPQLNTVAPVVNAGLDGNLIKQYQQNPQIHSNAAIGQPKRNIQPEVKPSEPVRHYVPSSSGVQLQQNVNINPDKLTAVMQKADRAEQEAMKYLSGH